MFARQSVPVSVVVPVYNRPNLLHAALQSIEAQTVRPHEIVVVDDGSANEAEIAGVAALSGALVVRQENAGPSAARNAGLAAARAPWAAFLDSDDVWLPAKLALQWEAACGRPDIGAVINNYRVFTALGALRESAFEVNVHYRAIRKRPVGPEVVELDGESAGLALLQSMFAQVSGLLVRRELALGLGGFDVAMGRSEDHEFVLRLFAATRVLAIERPLVSYRVHEESLSRNEVEMRLGDVRLAERILRHPERYPVGADRLVTELRPLWVRKAAASYVKRGDVGAARALLAPLARSDGSLKTWAMYAATCVVPSRLSVRQRRLVLALWRRRPWRRAEPWETDRVALREMRAARGETHE